jgi:hypothetical protein
VWTTTTVVGAAITVALVCLLGLDVLAAAVAPARGRVGRSESKERRRLVRIAAVVAALFVVVVAVRLALILVDYPGPRG